MPLSARCLLPLLLALPLAAQARWRIEVAAPPATPADAALYLAGNMNGWKPGDPAWRLQRQPGGAWTGSFTLEPGFALQFKVTRGSWETVEKGPKGEELANRTADITEGAALAATVAAWRDQAPAAAPASTVTGDLRILEGFAMPELGRTGTLRILLPPGYATATARYGVLYLLDGQNLFDAATSFAGEWGVDEALPKLAAEGRVPPLIVVGVDHGGDRRTSEYAPFADARLPEPPRGDATAAFLATTLKPWVDRTYRTRPEAAHTALGGSSLGGLMALHTALRHPGVFGRVACFSGSFWVGEGAMAKAIAAARLDPGLRLYLDMGDKEAGSPEDSRRAVQDTEVVGTALRARGLGPDRLKVLIAPGARHTERAWAVRFPDALAWLLR